jgi:hypothetical protein
MSSFQENDWIWNKKVVIEPGDGEGSKPGKSFLHEGLGMKIHS